MSMENMFVSCVDIVTPKIRSFIDIITSSHFFLFTLQSFLSLYMNMKYVLICVYVVIPEIR